MGIFLRAGMFTVMFLGGVLPFLVMNSGEALGCSQAPGADQSKPCRYIKDIDCTIYCKSNEMCVNDECVVDTGGAQNLMTPGKGGSGGSTGSGAGSMGSGSGSSGSGSMGSSGGSSSGGDQGFAPAGMNTYCTTSKKVNFDEICWNDTKKLCSELNKYKFKYNGPLKTDKVLPKCSDTQTGGIKSPPKK